MGSFTTNARVDIWQKARSFLQHHTGHPRDVEEPRVIEFQSERQFVELLHEGLPVAVAFTIRCPWTRRFDRVMEDAAAEFYPHVKFVRVECPKYPGFCIARQRKDYPFVEIFHSPKAVICPVSKSHRLARQDGEESAGAREGTITRYSVNVLPFNFDMSPYGFREFFKAHNLSQASPARP